MKKTIFIILTLLMVSLSQVFGQKTSPNPGVPPVKGAKRIFVQDFGGNDADELTTPTANAIYRVASVAQAQKILPYNSATPNKTVVSYGWNNYVGGTSGTPQGTLVSDGHWALVKFITGAVCYPPWFANASGQYPAFQDHTSNDGTFDANKNLTNATTIKGYMMLVNGAGGKDDQFFNDTIKNLCSNVRLCISVYVGNLIRKSASGGYNKPKLGFTVTTLSGDTIPLDDGSKYFAAPPIDFYDTPTWVRDSIWFTNTNNTDIIFHIFNTQTATAGNDMVLDDIEVWMTSPTVTIEGSHSYCEGDNLNLTADTVDTYKSFNNPIVRWQYSSDKTAWTILDQTDPTGLTYKGQAKAGWYMAVFESSGASINDKCSVTDTIQVNVAPKNSTLYWRPTGGQDQDWKNTANWEDINGNPVNFYPTECVDVHIPGNAERYPLLYTLPTAGDSLACHDIWFHFGGLIGKPHLLKYHYAYVQYNFGTSAAAPDNNQDFGYAGNVNTLNNVLFSTTPMNRGQWYALAAPLQKIASGDFAEGGYPKTWQQGFVASSTTNIPGSGTTKSSDGKWYTPVNTDNWDVGDQYNAIAIWAGDNVTTTGLGEGPNFQTNLDALKGILEMPYFDNPDIIKWHTRFEQVGTTSKFPYFYDKLNVPGDPTQGFVFTGDYGTMDRGKEAYRFIIEGPPFTSSISTTGDHLYTMTVPTGSEIMVGNPFFSQLDFDAFTNDNTGITKYRLYVGNNFTAYSSTAGSASATGNPTGTDQYIAPLQAFFITPTTSSLTFNADKVAPADPFDNKLRSSVAGSNMKADVLYLKAESPAGKSYLTLSMQEVNEKNLILLLPDGYPEVPQIYATDQTGQRNAIQFEGGYVGSVPLGVLSSDSDMVTLTVQNADNMAVDSLILWDKYANKKVDLKITDSYTFRNVPSVSDRFVLIAGNKVITGIAAPEVAGSIRATVYGNTLYVSASSEISSVSVISLEGITLSKVTGIGQNTYTQRLNLPKGVYLVYVKTENGETKAVKIVVNG